MNFPFDDSEAGNSPAFLLYLEAYEEAMEDIVESTLEQLFPGAENSSADELMKIKELSSQMIANSQKITRRIFDDMVQEYNL